jgi:hypothetical protein
MKIPENACLKLLIVVLETVLQEQGHKVIDQNIKDFVQAFKSAFRA